MVGVIVQANIEIFVVTTVHDDFLCDALEEVIRPCTTEHQSKIQHTRLEDQQAYLLLEDGQATATFAANIEIIVADIVTFWALHNLDFSFRGTGDTGYASLRTICS
jgi:hypothetical protein